MSGLHGVTHIRAVMHQTPSRPAEQPTAGDGDHLDAVAPQECVGGDVAVVADDGAGDEIAEVRCRRPTARARRQDVLSMVWSDRDTRRRRALRRSWRRSSCSRSRAHRDRRRPGDGRTVHDRASPPCTGTSKDRGGRASTSRCRGASWRVMRQLDHDDLLGQRPRRRLLGEIFDTIGVLRSPMPMITDRDRATRCRRPRASPAGAVHRRLRTNVEARLRGIRVELVDGGAVDRRAGGPASPSG